MSLELNDFRSRLEMNGQESETYKKRIEKLLAENTNMGEEFRSVQENLRLSSSQVGKLSNELKMACNEI